MNTKTIKNQTYNLFIIVFLLFSTCFFGQTTSVPDAIFEGYLETHNANGNSVSIGDPNSMGNGTVGDFIVTTSKISAVTSLDVSNFTISDLTGIEDFIALQILNCSHNNLTSLNVTQNTALTQLMCNHNQINSLDVTQNTTLTNLNCSFNSQITSLNLSSNISLINLDCSNEISDNNTPSYRGLISSLIFSQNNFLETINCSGNSISNIDLSNLNQLTYLDCSLNKLTSLDISSNLNLEELISNGIVGTFTGSIGTHELTSLDVSQNFNLKKIDIAGNLITNIDLSNLNQLTYLNCSVNKLKILNISNNNLMTRLNCSFNELFILNAKNGNNNILIDFYSSYNPLTCIEVDDEISANANLGVYANWTAFGATYSEDCFTYVPDNNFEQAIIDLGFDTVLDGYVSNNQIENLSSLSIPNKNISDLTGIEAFTSLQTLEVYGNQLTSVDLSLNISLQDLNVGNNSLTSINIGTLTNLNNFICNNNNLTTLDVSTNTQLTKLWCYSNQLQVLSLNSNINLTDIRCQHNNLNLLEIKNANNTNITSFSAHHNSNLTCIEVDLPSAFNPFWGNVDAQTNFNNNCHYFDTYIPDTTFEAYLETHDENGNIVSSALSMGNGISGDHYVTTANINTVLNLNISNLTISDLTGIESFVLLENLDCSFNNLTSLNISQNTSLINLYCQYNSLTNLTTYNNDHLSVLFCTNNQLTNIIFPQQTGILFQLFCDFNQLSNLDLSAYTNLNRIGCADNQLTQLNVQNGNNINATLLNAVNNSNLTCIQIDNGFTPNANWFKDATASYNTNCHYNETYVPGDNFELALIGFGLDTVLDNYVLTSNINTVTYLSFASLQIADMTGIEDFTALTDLRCEDNQITSIDISNLVALEYFWCYNNQLTDLDLTQNTNLKHVECNDNQITNLNLTQNVNLEAMECSNNLLTSLNLSQNLLLSHLLSGNNQITSLDIGLNTALDFLQCERNQITYLDVSNNPLLETIRCYDNQLTGLNISQNTILEELDCSNNLMTDLILSQNSTLTKIDCQNNKLTNLDVSLQSVLDDLSIQNNLLTQLKVNNNNNVNFTNFNATTNPNLTCIQIDNSFIPNANWQKDATTSYSINCHLNETYIPDNNFETYLEANGMGNGIANDNYVTTSNINSITTLAINNKNIADLTGIEDFIALINLDCEYNQLVTVDFSNNTALVTLRCNNNNIINLDLFPNIALQTLYCNNNALTNLQITSGSLVNLYCENNQISLLDLSQFFNLVNVHCFNNALTELNLLNSVGNLIDLRCNNNQINNLDIDANINLTTLHCGDNQLTSLVLSTNTALEDLRCNNNQLTNLFIDSNLSLRILLCQFNNLDNIDLQQNTLLTDLYCHNNQFTDLNLSQNSALIELRCHNNQLTSLVSPSAFLQFLNCNDNNITNLDVSQNTALVDLKCSGNQLTNLDVSANIVLVAFNCSANNLTRLNLKNGNNLNMTTEFFDATGNSNLICIEVDNVTYSTTNWTNIDLQTTYNLNCHYGETYVPDNNFEQALINLGYDIVLDDYVTTSNISNLANLDVSLKNISDLTGIEDFVGLVNLNCSANNLTNLDITNNTALTELIVALNQLMSLDVTQNINLLFLACEGNPFTNGLDITQNILLQDLIVNNLNLTSLDISLNDDLQTVICYNNSITVLDFTGKQDLTEVQCQNNQLTDLYLRENPLLTFANCSNNLLTDLTIDNGNNTAIPGNNFYATNNNLTCIQVDDVAYSNSNWINIDATVNYSTNCATFGLTNIPDNNFENYLETHDANGNVVVLGSAISMGNGIANDDFVFTNRISTVTVLHIENENISDLTGIQDFIALVSLDCDTNNLTTLDVTQNVHLIHLDFYGNQITTIDLSNNISLVTLYCYGNQLTNLNLSTNTALWFLSCSQNQFTSLDLSNNLGLTRLICAIGQLTSLNIKNGNNSNIVLFDVTSNPNLTCIEVDDITIPSTPTWLKDASANYSTNCNPATTIWEFGQWTNGVPTINNHAVIRDNYDTNIGNIEANTLTVEANKTVTILANNYIKLQSDLINNGIFIIENTGSFVQVDNTALNIGSGIFKTIIETTVLDDVDRFTYFSSPSQTETLSVFNSWADNTRIWDFDVVIQDWNLLNGTEQMFTTKGFAVKPSTSNTFPFNATTEFMGYFNNGIFSQPLIFNSGGIDDDNNLVGNPYPSAIDANMLLNNNTGTNAFYFWTHQSALGSNGYLGDDYAIWNNLGGIASASGSPAPSGFIASGQGFFVEANAPGSLIFENSIRVVGNNSDFRNSNPNEEDKIWINLTTDEDYFSQILIGFITQGTDGFNPTFDATRINGGSITSFYSLGQNNEHFGIESRGILNQEETITLGISLLTQITSNFTLSIDHFENLEGVTVFVKDNLLNRLHNLSIADYQFNINEIGVFENRFELILRKTILDTQDELISKNHLIVTNIDDSHIHIKTTNNSIIKQLKIYDVLGKLIVNSSPNNNHYTLDINNSKGNVLFIKARLIDNHTIITKFIKN